METASEVLLLIVSATLFVFLTVSIVALVKLIKILNQLKRVSQKVEHVADTAEDIGDFFHRNAAPAAAAKFITNLVSSFKSKDKK